MPQTMHPSASNGRPLLGRRGAVSLESGRGNASEDPRFHALELEKLANQREAGGGRRMMSPSGVILPD